MRTQEDSIPFNPQDDRGDDRETDLDNDSKTLQHERKNAFKSPGSLPDEQNRKNPIHAPKDTTRPIGFGVGQLQDAVVYIYNLRVVKIILILYLVFFVPRPESPIESLCKIPGLSGYSYCARKLDLPRQPVATLEKPVITIEKPVATPKKPVAIPDFVTLAGLQSRLEQVMKESASSSKVAVDIKTSEMALRDLGTVVKHSALSKKHVLGRDLKSFVDHAKATSANLQQFGSRVWGAVDRIVSLNEHTLLILESTPTSDKDNEAPHSQWGSKGGDVALRVPDPKEMENIWLQGIGLLRNTLRKLIHEAQHNVGSLQQLEERLNNIVDMVKGEEHEIMDKELAHDPGTKLKQQWFRELFGMNNGEWHSHSMSHALLEMVKKDRQNALNHVTDVLLQLNRILNDLNDLREDVAAPLLIAHSSNIPIEAHIESIRGTTERLLNGQINMREIEDEYRRGKFSG